MAYKLIVKEEAIADAVEAFQYYEPQSPGLGERFLRNLVECYHLISSNPTHYGYVFSDKERTFRDVKMKSFPYVVIYDFIGDEVILYAAHNCHRKPWT